MNQDKKAVIVSGGHLQQQFSRDIFEKNQFDIIIAADSGLRFFYDAGYEPTHIVGDFDSVGSEVLTHFRQNTQITFRQFQPEKDLTDTEIAIELAIEQGATDILILGGSGSRLDHTLATIQCMVRALEKEIVCCMLDEKNAVHLVGGTIHEAFIEKHNQYGDYISLLPLTTTVEGVTLTGFKYPLENHTLTSDNSLGVSNEIIDEAGTISFRQGILIVIESRD